MGGCTSFGGELHFSAKKPVDEKKKINIEKVCSEL
jgi:hypothetical protein